MVSMYVPTDDQISWRDAINVRAKNAPIGTLKDDTDFLKEVSQYQLEYHSKENTPADKTMRTNINWLKYYVIILEAAAKYNPEFGVPFLSYLGSLLQTRKSDYAEDRHKSSDKLYYRICKMMREEGLDPTHYSDDEIEEIKVKLKLTKEKFNAVMAYAVKTQTISMTPSDDDEDISTKTDIAFVDSGFSEIEYKIDLTDRFVYIGMRAKPEKLPTFKRMNTNVIQNMNFDIDYFAEHIDRAYNRYAEQKDAFLDLTIIIYEKFRNESTIDKDRLNSAKVLFSKSIRKPYERLHEEYEAEVK
ncbi:hypothetical protein FACS1894105_00480 [Clostridia bacterium]|nr:hypothetical protein FACS1894105_00480 [Clostridia bacterium]